jgi:uncharacterized protein YbaP (TraB family)
MNNRLAFALILSFLTLPALAQTQSDAAPASVPAGEPPQALEAAPAQIVVTGRRPGPGVWKVSKDGHVMWVFGLYSPLPKNMEWDAGRVERLVAQSQALLMPPSAEAHVGFLKGLTLLPQMPRLIGIQNNPDGATLQDVLPPEVYAHWTSLKAKYIGDDKDVERLRPIFAAQRLQRAGRDHSGLSNKADVRERIMQIAKANKVRLAKSGVSMELDNVGQALTDFKQNRLNDAACLARTLDSLEQDLDAMQQRANAWANGNIAEIQGLDFSTRDNACDDAILGSVAVQNNAGLRSMRERLRESWLAAAEKQIAANSSTFALLEMKDLFDPKGYLAVLQARGYTVESPK